MQFKNLWSNGGLEFLDSGLPVYCSTNWTNLTKYGMLLIAYMNVASFIVMFNLIMIFRGLFDKLIFEVLRTSGLIKDIKRNP